MKMMVSDASRMFSAISFGVFCRFAPSTRAIIRSMKVSPGLDVIFTTIRSDSTVVPPVTGDVLARLDHDIVAEAQLGARHRLLAESGRGRPELPVEQPACHRFALGA